MSKISKIRLQIYLTRKKIVARFKGRCEWGARSLGNRSILAHPSFIESFYKVNDTIKSRDFWMPFAPSILASSASKYLVNYDKKKVEVPFMITAFDSSHCGKDVFKAAIHFSDHTLRPQVVSKEKHPLYYKLISTFSKISGVAGILNTSFNLHGKPIVSTPEQAIYTLENSALKYLAIENYLLEKKD